MPSPVSGIKRRLNGSDIEHAVASSGGKARVQELHAPMGSVVVFEISSVHVGLPCAEGERISLTNYYKVSKKETSCAANEHVKPGPFKRVGR